MPRKNWLEAFDSGKATLQELVAVGWDSNLRKRELAKLGFNRDSRSITWDWDEFRREFGILSQLGYTLERYLILYPGNVYCQRNRRDTGASLVGFTVFYTVNRQVSIYRIVPPAGTAIVTNPFVYVSRGTAIVGATVNPYRTRWTGFNPWTEAFKGVRAADGRILHGDDLVYSGM